MTDLHKRLEEAAEKYAVERIGNQYPLLSEFRRRALATHDNFTLEEAFADGAEYGFKEAINVAKEWMQNYFPDELDGKGFEFVSRDEILADFESEMLKLWEEQK